MSVLTMWASASPTSSGPREFYVDVLGFEPWRELTFPDEAVGPAPPPEAAGRHDRLYLRMDGFVLEMLHFAGIRAPPRSPTGNG